MKLTYTWHEFADTARESRIVASYSYRGGRTVAQRLRKAQAKWSGRLSRVVRDIAAKPER